MSYTAQSRKQHENIVALVQEVSVKLDRVRITAEVQQVRLLLAKMAGLVNVHLAREDKGLYPSLMKSDDAKVRSMAKHPMEEMGGIAGAFTAYYTKWTACEMRNNADGFISETSDRYSC